MCRCGILPTNSVDDTIFAMDLHAQERMRNTRRYLLIGLLTAAPLWVTWLVFDFIFTQLSKLGTPWVLALSRGMRRNYPAFADFLLLPQFQSLLGVVFTLVVLYSLGWLASQVIGQRIIGRLERLVQNIPLVAAIYGGTKRFLAVIKEKPTGVQRVVLISFPSPDMKAVGFVTRVIRDEAVQQCYRVSPGPDFILVMVAPHFWHLRSTQGTPRSCGSLCPHCGHTQ